MDHLYIESRDATRIHLARWSPDTEPRGDVLLCHGLAEHMGRYDHVATALTKAGWRAWGLELRGHGDSEGKRGHVNAWQEYVDDLAAAAAAVGGPHYLLGHSMGGTVVLDALRGTLPFPVRGVVLSNPMLGFAVEAPGWKIGLAGFLSRYLPRVSLGNELVPANLSRDPAVVESYAKDPRVFRTITPRWYTEALGAIQRIFEHAPRYDTPLLALTSTADRICDNTATVTFSTRYGGPTTRTCYGPLYHELFNEPEKERIFGDVVAWLDRSRSQEVA